MQTTGSPSRRPIRKAPGSIAWKAKRSVLAGFQPSSFAQSITRTTSSALAVAISKPMVLPLARPQPSASASGPQPLFGSLRGRGEELVLRPWQAEILAQGPALVHGAEQAAALQLGD